ncbi:MAG: glycosyltransferase family 4 protein [Chloroflexota bacterium]
MTAPLSAVYVLPGKVGGIVNFVDNLLAYGRADGWKHYAILTYSRLDDDTPFEGWLAGDEQRRVEHSLPIENLYTVLRRLARAVPPGPGVMIANDWLELAMLGVHPIERTVVSITHGDFDYYYDLAERHEPLIDCFVTYTRRMYDRLTERLPHRRDSVFNLPYGVVIPGTYRTPVPGPLRLLYVGRMNRFKGIFDLPAIHAELLARDVEVTWTLQGVGPDEAELRRRWDGYSPARWTGLQPMDRVLALYREHDVLVMPSRAEGLPVALLEAMAAGVVPVVSDLPGVREIVEPGVTGYRPPVDDVTGFADAIAGLARDRNRLESVSLAARRLVAERFDIRERAPDYQALYARWRELRRPKPTRFELQYGSRLDSPWLPNALVRAVRTVRRSWRRCCPAGQRV